MNLWNNKREEKQKSEPLYELTAADGETLFRGKVSDLPLREEAVLQKSIEFFQDPEPCYIHRSAVMMRLYTEISDSLTQSKGLSPAALKSYAVNGTKIERYRLILS